MKLQTLLTDGDFVIEKYTPTLLRPFYIKMSHLSLPGRVRFAIDFYYGYSVYYLKKNGEYIGYCTITSGMNKRFWFATEKDIIVGPYYIDKNHRGNGYVTYLVENVIYKCHNNWENAYAYILHTNIPSIKAFSKLSGKKIFNVHNTFTRKLIQSDKGEYGIYKIVGEKIE